MQCHCIDATPRLSPAATALPAPGDPLQGTAQRQLSPAPVLVLLSGGVDSTLIAALAHRALPASVPIDLASVCFDGGRSPDRLAAQDALEELHAYAPGRRVTPCDDAHDMQCSLRWTEWRGSERTRGSSL